jgi:hypothetical protein
MKAILQLLLGCFLSWNALAGVPVVESLPTFHVRKDSLTSELGNNKSLMHLRITNIEFTSQNVQQEIQGTVNGVWKTFKMNRWSEFDLEVEPGAYTFEFFLNSNYRKLHIENHKIEASHTQWIDLLFESDEEHYPVMVKKPVIYTYGNDQACTIALQPKGTFTFTYPNYQDSWKGIAHKDGSFSIGTANYPYLFWEGEQDLSQLLSFESGFVVSKGEVISFLETKLNEMGFNQKEKTDFITFWGPIMSQSNEGFARFLFTEEYDAIAKMDIQPKPEGVFRLYLLWTPLDNQRIDIAPKAQVMPHVNRNGFHILEWGGSVVPMKEL